MINLTCGGPSCIHWSGKTTPKIEPTCEPVELADGTWNITGESVVPSCPLYHEA